MGKFQVLSGFCECDWSDGRVDTSQQEQTGGLRSGAHWDKKGKLQSEGRISDR